MSILAMCGTVLLSVLASTGIAAVVVKFIVEGALKDAQEKRKRDTTYRQEKAKMDDAWKHQVGRTLFWIYHGIKRYEQVEDRGYWNGELMDSLDKMKEIEVQEEALDRDRLAKVIEPK
jgi:hypothetical protein